MKVLFLISEQKELSSLRNCLKNNPSYQYYLCPLTIQARQLLKDSDDFNSCHLVNFAQILSSTSLEVRDEYMDFISSLARREFLSTDLIHYFSFSKNYSHWWLSLVYEKGPGKSQSFLKFAKIAAILRIKQKFKCEQVWVSSYQTEVAVVLHRSLKKKCVMLKKNFSTPTFILNLKFIVIEWLRAGKFFLVSFWKIICIRLKGLPSIEQRQRLKTCSKIFVTMFPFLDEEKLEEGEFFSKPYAGVQRSFDESNEDYAWLAMHNQIYSSTWSDSLALSLKIKRAKRPFFLLEEWLGVQDILSTVWEYLWISLKCYGVLSRMPGLTEHTLSSGEKLQLWGIIRSDFISSFAGKVLIANLAYLRMYGHLIDNLDEETTIVHFAEMHAWERCLQIASQKKGIKIVGVQHTIVPLLLLNYFPNKKDILDDNYVTSAPMPQHLGCVGEVTKKFFIDCGWSKERLFTFGAFRFEGVKSLISEQKLKSKTFQVIVAFSINIRENEELFYMLYYAFNDGKFPGKIILKSHPCESVEYMARRLNLNLDVFDFATKSLEEHILESDLMIAGSTSSMFYALVKDVPVIMPHFYDAVALDPLSGVYKICSYVDSPEELRETVQKMINPVSLTGRGEFREWLFTEYMNIPQDDAEYRKRINDAIGSSERMV